MTSDRLEIYDLLGVVPDTITIGGVQVVTWGTQVIFDCQYGARSFQLMFDDCRSLQWDVLGKPDEQDKIAEVMGIFLGAENHHESAIIHTDVFEISVLYGTFTLVKDW